MIIFKSILFKSCNAYYTGKFHLELYDSKIVVFDKSETVIPQKKVKDSEVTIPVDMCLMYIDKIVEYGFFGEIDIYIKDGKICEIMIRKIYKLESIKKVLSDIMGRLKWKNDF